MNKAIRKKGLATSNKKATKASPATNGTDLDNLAKDVRKAHEETLNGLRTTFDRAVECGKLLALVKRKVARGQFEKFVEENCSLSLRAAQVYMQLAANEAKILAAAKAQRVAPLVRNAIKLIAAPKTKRSVPSPYRTPSAALLPPFPVDAGGDDMAEAEVMPVESAAVAAQRPAGLIATPVIEEDPLDQPVDLTCQVPTHEERETPTNDLRDWIDGWAAFNVLLAAHAGLSRFVGDQLGRFHESGEGTKPSLLTLQNDLAKLEDLLEAIREHFAELPAEIERPTIGQIVRPLPSLLAMMAHKKTLTRILTNHS